MNTLVTDAPVRTLNETEETSPGDFDHGSEVPGPPRALIRPYDFRDEAHEGKADAVFQVEEEDTAAWVEPMNKSGAPVQDFPGADDEQPAMTVAAGNQPVL